MLLLVDGNNLMWRSLYGGDPLHRPSDGATTNATLNFVQALAAIISRYKPDRGVVAFDGPGPSFRVLLAPDYKGTREREETTPENAKQIEWMRRAVVLTGMTCTDSAPYEADDVLATLALSEPGRVVVASDDKDLTALVRGNRIIIHRFRDGMEVDEDTTRKKWGVAPTQVSDLLAMAGDAIDNHAGIAGVGSQRAAKLLKAHGSIEKILLAGPSVQGVRWARIASSAPYMLAMAATTRFIRAQVPKPHELLTDWQYSIANVIAALEAPEALDRFCRARRLNIRRVVADTEICSKNPILAIAPRRPVFGKRNP